ncbi:MAG: hypothetical protein AABY22_18480 [Nanoarchaeota archaeon]
MSGHTKEKIHFGQRAQGVLEKSKFQNSKLCRTCNKIKKINDFYSSFHKDNKQNYFSKDCKSCEKIFHKQYREQNKHIISLKLKHLRKKEPERYHKYSRKYRKKLKTTIYKMISNNKIECVNCGCNIFEALEINHKFGGGTKENKKRMGKRSGSALQFYKSIRDKKYDITKLELVCIPCNAIHRAIMKLGKNHWNITFTKFPKTIEIWKFLEERHALEKELKEKYG